MKVNKEQVVVLAVNHLEDELEEMVHDSAYSEFFTADPTDAQRRAIRKSLEMAVKMAMMK